MKKMFQFYILYFLRDYAGIIRFLRDGIGEVLGLSDVQSGELVLSEQNYGLVLNLQQFFSSCFYPFAMNFTILISKLIIRVLIIFYNSKRY